MARNEHSIRVSAKGEFGQLQRGLKNLQSDLRGVLGEIDKGARKGGVFDDTSLRALDIYRNRFKGTMEELNREFEKQNRIIDELHEKKLKAPTREAARIQETINKREQELDVIRRQLFETEKMYGNRNAEAEKYERLQKEIAKNEEQAAEAAEKHGRAKERANRADRGRQPYREARQRQTRDHGGTLIPGAMGSMMSRGRGLAGGIVGGILGMAGIAGIGSMAHQAYQSAYTARTAPMDLAQRVRGQDGWTGDSYDMWNRGYGIGTRDKMGYTAEESWNFLDMYSREAGTLGGNEMGHLLKFGRAYGLTPDEVAGGISANRELGGTETAGHFADMVASSVETSRMQPRILEVMETSAGLLANLNTTLKDSGSKEILTYQTILDKIGNEQGMMGLTGASGANIISGLGGIFDPQAEQWKYMGMQALQGYKPEKYGDMDLYGLERAFEDGLLNNDNLPAMTKYLREASGGDESLMKRMLQRWLQDGGYNATKTQVDDLYGATGGFTAFSEENLLAFQKQLENGDAEEPYRERMTEIGQGILDTNARFEKQIEELGQPLLEFVQGIKEDITSILEDITESNAEEILGNILGFLQDNWKYLATGAALALLGGVMLRGMLGLGGMLLSGLGRVILASAVGMGKVLMGTFSGLAKLMGFGKGKNGPTVVDTPDGKGKKGKGKKGIPPILGAGGKAAGIALGIGGFGLAGSYLGGAWDAWRGDPDNEYKAVIGDPYMGPSYPEEIDGGDPRYKFKEGDEEDLGKYLQGLQDQGELNLEELNMRGSTSLSDFGNSGAMSLDQFSAGGTGALDLFSGTGMETLNIFGETSEEIFGSLYEESTSMFEGLMTGGLGKLDDLMAGGLESMSDLFKSGDLSFESLYRDGSAYLQGVFDEHSGFKEFFAGLWNDLTTQLLGGALGGAAGGSYDVRNNSGVSASALNSKLGGKLAGTGAAFMQAGQKYGIDPAFLASLAMHETGNGTSNAIRNKNNVGGMMGRNGLMTFDNVWEGIDAMASNLKRLYIDQGLTTVEQIQKKYAPNGAANDPTGLNAHWVSGVTKFLNQFGVSTGGGSYTPGGGSVFHNWEKKITSRFGAMNSVRGGRAHSGLDIDGDQGDRLDAVAGGTITKVFNDPKNTTAGGSTVMVRMADGKSYAYSHLSAINPQLKEGMNINAGTWLGNMGGDRGKPGSGYSTTGSHLHLGLYDRNGKATNPEPWLKQVLGNGGSIRNQVRGNNMLEIGDLDIDELMAASKAEEQASRTTFQNTEAAPTLWETIKETFSVNRSSERTTAAPENRVAKLEVSVNLAGEGVSQLNSMTLQQLEILVRKIVAEREYNRLMTTPTVRGY